MPLFKILKAVYCLLLFIITILTAENDDMELI